MMIFWLEYLLRAEGAPAAPGGLSQTIGPMLPILLMVLILYFLVIRPQHKKQKEHQKFLSELKKGDWVITTGGVMGMVKNLTDKIATLEIDENVSMKILRSQISENAANLKENKEKGK